MIAHGTAAKICEFVGQVHDHAIVLYDVLVVQGVVKFQSVLERNVRRTTDTAKRPSLHDLFRIVPKDFKPLSS